MKVGVIGAGTMGQGIAKAFAQVEGYEVALCDINDEFAANGKKKIAKGFEKRVARGKMDQAKADAILAKIGNELVTVDEIVTALDSEEVTRNKVTARLGKLVKAGRIVKEPVKVEGNKRMAYRLTPDADTTEAPEE